MALPSSGSISLSQVAVELGRSSSATTSLGESAVRTLAGVASGAISLYNLYGKSNFQMSRSTYTYVTSPGSGTISVPTGATLMRVAAIGAGGAGHYGTGSYARYGGGGGGCAASKTVQASSISYTVGTGGSSSGASGGNTTASFTGYTLTGYGGSGASANGAGGSASGGDYNYAGGTADGTYFAWAAVGGAGAAGPHGPGGNASSQQYFDASPPGLGSVGWGVGGGAGGGRLDGNSTDSCGPGGGPGGPSIPGRQVSSGYIIIPGATPWNPQSGNSGDIRALGVGAGGITSIWGSSGLVYGGHGGVFVEWFYPV